MTRDKGLEDFLSLIRRIAQELSALEEQAQESLTSAGDQETYRKKHLEKTLMLMSLPDRIAPFLPGLGPGLRTFAQQDIKEFAEDAKMAHQVNSLFYMSVLLAPEGDTANNTANAFDHFVHKIEQLCS
jgi:hypothetical protein